MRLYFIGFILIASMSFSQVNSLNKSSALVKGLRFKDELVAKQLSDSIMVFYGDIAGKNYETKNWPNFCYVFYKEGSEYKAQGFYPNKKNKSYSVLNPFKYYFDNKDILDSEKLKEPKVFLSRYAFKKISLYVKSKCIYENSIPDYYVKENLDKKIVFWKLLLEANLFYLTNEL